MPFMIRKTGEVDWQHTNALLIGSGISLNQLPDGLPEITSSGSGGADAPGEKVILPTGDAATDRSAIQQALWSGQYSRIRLGRGEFQVDSNIFMKEDTVLTGTGSNGTRIVKHDFNGSVFHLGDDCQCATIENLTIEGPGAGGTGSNSGIVATRSTNNPAPDGIARRIRLRNLTLRGLTANAIELRRVAQVELENILIEDPGAYGVYLDFCGSVRTSTVRVVNALSRSFLVLNSRNIVFDACEGQGGAASFFLNSTRAVVLNGCRTAASSAPAIETLFGGYHVINGFLADQSEGAFTDVPFVRVDRSVGIVVNAIRRWTNAGGTLTAEVDVADSDGIVLFSRHNFDAAKIVSGGKFANASFTTVP